MSIAKNIEVEVENLKFDPENPRLPISLKGGNKDRAVFEYMILNGNITELMLSISESGFFSGEPLLVVPDINKKSYLVVEGNRRLAALKLLTNPELAPTKKKTINEIASSAANKPKMVQCICYDNRKEVIDFLGYRHVTGIEEWDSLMKARYLEQLYYHYSGQGDTAKIYGLLAKKIGSRADYVKKLLVGYKIFKHIEENKFYEIPNLSEDNFEFSLLTTALGYKNLKDFAGNVDFDDKEPSNFNEENLKYMVKWIYEKNQNNKTVLGESRNLGILDSIVVNVKSLEKLKNTGSLDEAKLFSGHPKEVFQDSIQRAVASLETAKAMSHYLEEFPANTTENLKSILALAREINILKTYKDKDSNFEL